MTTTHARLPLLLLLPLLAATAVYAQSPVPEGAEVEQVADGFQFTEGPYWHPDGYLLFSDIPANTIVKWSPEGGTEVFLNPSGNSNGITADAQGRLILAQHGPRRVLRLEADGTETVLADSVDGKRLNSPNDLVVKSDGAVYFTDPPYGISAEQEELGFYGVYRAVEGESPQRLDDTLERPNGLVFSPDESVLYVNDSQNGFIRAYDVQEDGTLDNAREFAAPGSGPTGGPDGMKVDVQGNLYTTGPGGIWIYAPNGERRDVIPVPEAPANLAWGGADRKTLYITARTGLYRIPLNVEGVVPVAREPNEGPSQGQAGLHSYPNPFDTAATLHLSVPEQQPVRVEVFDVQGRRMAVLHDGWVRAHTAEQFQVDGSAWPEGTYLVRVTGSEFTEARALTLAR